MGARRRIQVGTVVDPGTYAGLVDPSQGSFASTRTDPNLFVDTTGSTNVVLAVADPALHYLRRKNKKQNSQREKTNRQKEKDQIISQS